MSKELIISATRHETRVAVIEEDQVVELYHQRENEYSLAGSIHKGRVTRVLPGMQSAFVDIGLGRDAFLYVSDFFEDNDEYDKIVSSVEEKVLKLDRVPVDLPTALRQDAAQPVAARQDAAQAVIRGATQDVTQAVSQAVTQSETQAETQEAVPEETGTAAPMPVAEATAVVQNVAPLGPPASAMQTAPGMERRSDRGGGGDRGADRGGDRDRRGGRRSRRGRGNRGGGRGLPDSKFYSPRQEGEVREDAPSSSTAAGEEPAVQAKVVFDPEQDDFFVLPGESLAKYTGRPGDEQEAPAAAGPSNQASDVPEMASAATRVKATEGKAGDREGETRETVETDETGSEPDLVHQAVAEARVEAEEEAAQVAESQSARGTEEPVAVEPREAAAKPVSEEHVPVQMTALEIGFTAIETEDAVEAGPAGAATGAAADGINASDAESETESESGVAEAGQEIEAEGGEGQAEAVAGDEGPEPARMPTSLTATLREQGSRYPHRVSRRTRRKGRGDRGPLPEGQRTGQGDPRPQENRPEQRTDQRTGPRPEGRPEGRLESRPDAGPESRPDSRPEPRPDGRAEKSALPSISDLLREGQEIIVQIAKEPLGQKGARITSHIALPGRFLVYMPTVDHIGVSRKIPSDDERLRLKRILQANCTGIPGGYIVRTAGDGRTEEELRADMMFLYNLWLDMRQKAERRAAPLLIHHDLNVVERILRDQLTSSYKSVWVDNEEVYENVLRFVQRFQPALVSRVKMYTRSTPIFDEFGITAELEKALRPKVWLKSGGHIVINQTEALVAIDINTGKYVGKSNRLEDTIVKTNTDAVKEIVRQIRLRDLGGIIVVDFIDMDERKNRQKVMQALEEAMRADRAPYKILQFNDFGLVAITRKRVKQSLERTLCTPCPYCEGAGYVKSPQTVVGEILQEAHKIVRAVDGNVVLRVSPEVAKLLKSNQNTFLQEVEEILGRPVMVKSDPLLHQEKFDLA